MSSASRRQFLRASAGAGLAALAACSSSDRSEFGQAAEKPNIVLIMADDLGYEALGAYGGTSYATPNLDRLAAEGIRFDHAYSQPLCTPTRLQLMTGKYNFRNWEAFGVMSPEETTFGHMMKTAGYSTMIVGKWQLFSYNPPDFEPEWRGKGMKPEDAGFDDWYLWHAGHTEDKGSRYADPVVLHNGEAVADTEGEYGPDLFVNFLNNWVEDHRDEPFFVYYPMALTHGPFNPTPQSESWAEEDQRLNSNPKNFGDMVEYMDACVGRIVDQLDELGLRENTLVLFFSDNGTPKGIASRMGDRVVHGGKGLPTDAGTHVPLIANWPGVTPPGTVNDDLIDSTDFVPTLAELSGASLPPGTIDGVSFAAQLRGEPGHPRKWVLCWHDPRPGWAKEAYTELALWARDKTYKLYQDGRLYNVAEDPLEQNPIPPGEGGPDAQQAREKLQEALSIVPEDKLNGAV